LPPKLHKVIPDAKTLEAEKRKLKKTHKEEFKYEFTKEELDEWM
jgi:hypothetical protein